MSGGRSANQRVGRHPRSYCTTAGHCGETQGSEGSNYKGVAEGTMQQGEGEYGVGRRAQQASGRGGRADPWSASKPTPTTNPMQQLARKLSREEKPIPQSVSRPMVKPTTRRVGKVQRQPLHDGDYQAAVPEDLAGPDKKRQSTSVNRSFRSTWLGHGTHRDNRCPHYGCRRISVRPTWLGQC